VFIYVGKLGIPVGVRKADALKLISVATCRLHAWTYKKSMSIEEARSHQGLSFDIRSDHSSLRQDLSKDTYFNGVANSCCNAMPRAAN
jgi:hypothetical protein